CAPLNSTFTPSSSAAASAPALTVSQNSESTDFTINAMLAFSGFPFFDSSTFELEPVEQAVKRVPIISIIMTVLKKFFIFSSSYEFIIFYFFYGQNKQLVG